MRTLEGLEGDGRKFDLARFLYSESFLFGLDALYTLLGVLCVFGDCVISAPLNWGVNERCIIAHCGCILIGGLW